MDTRQRREVQPRLPLHGYPIDALCALVRQHGRRPGDIVNIEVRLDPGAYSRQVSHTPAKRIEPDRRATIHGAFNIPVTGETLWLHTEAQGSAREPGYAAGETHTRHEESDDRRRRSGRGPRIDPGDRRSGRTCRPVRPHSRRGDPRSRLGRSVPHVAAPPVRRMGDRTRTLLRSGADDFGGVRFDGVDRLHRRCPPLASRSVRRSGATRRVGGRTIPCSSPRRTPRSEDSSPSTVVVTACPERGCSPPAAGSRRGRCWVR